MKDFQKFCNEISGEDLETLGQGLNYTECKQLYEEHGSLDSIYKAAADKHYKLYQFYSRQKGSTDE